MIKSRALPSAVLIAMSAPALAAVQSPVASAVVIAEPLAPSALGATLRPRWRGSNDEIPYLGTARLDWAFRLRLPQGTTVRSATISGYAPVHLALSDGTCITAAPRNEVGGRVALDAVEEPCAGPAAPAPASSPAQSGSLGTTASHQLGFWRTPDGATAVTYAPTGEQVSKVPISAMAVGGLAVLHGGGEAVTLFGRMGRDFVVVSLTAPPRP